MAMRNFKFTWKSNENKYGPVITRVSEISVKNSGDLAIDAKTATAVFTTNFGSLKKNSILSIQEFDEKGDIGEPIVPSEEENAIIPVKKNK